MVNAGGRMVVADAAYDGMVVDTLAAGTGVEKVVVLVVEEFAARDNEEGVVG